MAIIVKKYYKGDDIKEPIQAWADDEKTIPLDIENDIIDIIIRLYISPTDVKKFSKTNRTGYIQLKKSTSYLYYLILEGDQTASMATGDIIIHVMVIQADGQMSDGRLNESSQGILAQLIDSFNEDEI